LQSDALIAPSTSPTAIRKCASARVTSALVPESVRSRPAPATSAGADVRRKSARPAVAESLVGEAQGDRTQLVLLSSNQLRKADSTHHGSSASAGNRRNFSLQERPLAVFEKKSHITRKAVAARKPAKAQRLRREASSLVCRR
jgi:hypothetical protein